MATFYYNGTGAQGVGDGSRASDASNASVDAISALSGGGSVEVTAGTFTLTAAEASGRTITGAGDVVVTAIDATPAAVLSGITVSGSRTGSVDNAVTFTGNLGGLSISVASGATLTSTVSILTGVPVSGSGSVSVSDAATVAQASSLDGTIATSLTLTTISDTAANLAGSSDAVLSLGTTVSASDAATAAQAATIAGFTTSVVYSISDSAANLAGATSAALNEAVNLTATTNATVAQAATIVNATNSGSNTYSISDSAANLASSSSAILDPASAISISGGTAAAADLNTANSITSVSLDSSGITTLTGTAAEVNAAYDANGSGTISGLGNEAVTLSDTTLAASVLNTVNGYTSGTVNAGSLTTLTGLLADVNTAYAAGTAGQISGLGDETVTITNAAGGSLLATDLSTAGAATTGTVTVTNAQTVTGTDTEVTAALVTAASKVVMGSASSATVSNATSAATGAAIATTSNVTASFTAGIQDTLANLASSGAATANLTSITTDQPAVVINISDTAGGTMTAADLSAVGSATTGAVSITNAQTINGTADQVIAAVVTAASKVTPNSGSTINASSYTNQDLSAVASSFTFNVTTATGAVLDSSQLATADTITIAAGSATIDAASTDEVALAAKTTVNNGTTLTVNNYVNTDLSGLTNQGTGSIVVNTTTDAVLDESKLADATSVVLGAAASGAASAIDGIGTNGNRINLNNQTLSVTDYSSENFSGITSAGTLNVSTATGAVLDATKLATADAITIAAGTASGTASDVNTLGEEKITIATGTTLNVSGYTNQELAGFTKQGTAILNVTTATGAVLDSANLADATTITIGTGSATIDAASTDEEALAAKITVNNGTTLTVNNYVNTDLSGLTNQGTGSIVVNTTTGAVLDETKLADATSVVLGAAATGAASAIDGIGSNGSRINLNGQTLSVSGYNAEDLSGISSSGTLNVTTVTGAVLDAAKLAYADAITVVGTNTATAADADTLGSRLGGTATVNITTDPITSSTDLSDLGSGLTLQFGGDSSVAVNGATLTVRQNQVSGYTINGSGTVAAGGTASADTFNASGISATLNLTSLAGNDTITVTPSDLGSADSIDGGSNTDTLSFSAAASGVVDVAFTNVSSVEILQLANATNSVTLGSEAEQAGITTVTGGTGADTLNLLYGTTGLTFNAGAGTDTLSYSADSAIQAITLTSISSGSASGTVTNGGSDSFSALEVIVGGSGSSDAITSTASGETLILTGANSGTIDGFSFSGVELVDLVSGNDTATINSGGSLSGNLSFGTGTDTLNYGSYGSAVSVTLSSISSGSGTTTSGGATGIAGVVSGVESITGSAASDTLTDGTGASTLVISGANSGTLNSLGFNGFETLDLSSGNDSATINSGASITSLVGGNGTDTLNLNGDANSVTISGSGAGSSSGTSFSGFETLNTLAGDDTITLDTAAATTQTIDAGSNTDILQIAGSDTSNNSLTLNTAGGGTLGGVGFSNVENITLGSGSDSVTLASGGGLIASQPGLLADYYVETGIGGIGSLIKSGVSLGPVDINDSTLASVTGQSDNVYVYARGYLTVPGSGSFNDFVVSTYTDDGVRVRLDLAGNGTYSTVIDNWTIHGGMFNNSSTLTVTAGQQIPIQIDYFEHIGGAELELYYQSSSQGLGRTLVPLSNLSSNTSGTSSGVLDLGAGNDVVTVQTGTLGVGSIAGGSGSDTLNYSSYGSAATVNLATGTATATGGISGFEAVIGSGSADTITASTSGDVNLQGNGSNDTFNVTIAGLTSSDSIDGGTGTNQLVFTDAGTINDSQFTNVTLIESVTLTGATTLNAGTEASQAGIATVVIGSGASTVNTTLTGYDLTVDASSLADNASLTLSGSASSNDFTVSGLTGSVLAGGTSGSLTITTGNASDNAIGVTTGSGATSITANGSGDTVTTNAGNLAQNTLLSLFGVAKQVVTNLIGNLTAASSSGTLNVSTGDAADNGISITTGSGDVVVTGGDASDTVTVTGLSSNGQTFTAQASTSNFSITSGANNQTITGSNTGNDTIDGGSGSDTLSYAGGSAVIVTVSGYSTQAGGSTGQGSDSFSNIESLVGSSGTDTLKGRSTDTDESVTLTGANSGTISDIPSTGTFSFNSFEQLDLQGGNDTVLLNNNSASLSSNLDLGSGTGDTLSYAGTSTTVSVTLTGISSNTGSTAAGGATGIAGTASGFEILVGGSGTADSITDSTGDSTIALTGANSGTIDGLAFSSIENLNLSTGNDTVTVTGSGSGVSLTGNLDLGDGTNSLSMSGNAGSIAAVNAGSGDDTMTISAGSVTGAVSAGDGSNTLTISGTNSSIGSYTSGTGSDSVILNGGDVVGNVSTGAANDTVLISSTSSTIGGNLDLGGGTGDTLSYAGYSNAVSVTLTGITSNTGTTAAGGATAITGTSTGFENLVGGSNSGDTITDSTGDSTVVISGANSGTIDGLAFSAIENLNLSTGIDGVTVQSGGSLSGTLDLGEGTSKTVQMNSGAGAIGVLTAGAGNDTVTIDGGSVSGAVTLGDGTNALTINNTNSSINSYSSGSGVDTIVSKGGDINGAISTGSAADSVTLSLGAVVTGNVTLGSNSTAADGADVLSLNASSIIGNVTTGSGSDTVSLSASSSVTGAVSLGIDGDTNGGGSADTLTLNASSISGSVTTGSGADSVSVLNASTITGTVTLGSNTDTADGADTLAVTGASSSNQSVISGSIATGAGSDVVSFNNATIGGTGQTISLGIDNNSLEGDDSLSAAATTITSNITTGTGSDTLTLSAGSVLAGDVSLGSVGDNTAISDPSNTFTDTFTSLNGWTGGNLESSSAYYGSFLGRYSNGAKTNGQDVSKSFTLNSQPATVSFDVNRLDSWDGEYFRAYINNSTAFQTNFRAGQAISSASGSINGFSWTITPKDNISNHGFGGWDDQTATVTIVVPSGYSTIKLGFGSTLDQVIDDESYGIDNLSITSSVLRNDDTLSLDASSISGNVSTGSGADTVSVLNASTITGNVTLGADADTFDGADTLTVTGASSSSKSVITGSIATGGGADVVAFTDATIGTPGGAVETLSLGTDTNSNDGNDSLTATRTTITAGVTTGSGADSVTLNDGSSITGTVSLGIDGDTATGSNGDTLTLNASSITGNVTTGSGTDAVSVLTKSTVTGDVTLGADNANEVDTLTVTGASSSNKSVITGSIATGGGADVVAFTDATIGSTGAILSLGSDSNSNDGGDSLTASNAAITATITTGSGSDSVSLSAGTSVTGSVTLGTDADTNDGNDTLTLTGASSIDGAVSFGAANDTFNLSTGITSPTTIKGTVSFGAGSWDTLSYAGNSGPITVAINSDSAGTATSAWASYVTGDVSGFEFIVGSNDAAATSGQTVATATFRDTIYDNTSSSLVILSGANQGTIEDIDFSSIENLQLRAGADTLSFRGTSLAPGLIAGLADGGGIEGASYSNGVYSGGSYSDASVDLLDYTQYLAGPVTVDLSLNQATGVFGNQAGGLVSGDGKIETSTQDSSFENVDGSAFNDTITGDDQTAQGNVLLGFGGNDTILGLAGNDTIDGGDGTSGADGADLIAAGDGADLILGSDGSDLISGGGYSMEGSNFFAVTDASVDTLSYIDENEGLDISLTGSDKGTVAADAAATLSISTFTGTYNGSGAQTISVPTNQLSTDWTDIYGDIQRLVLTNQNDILRIDTGDFFSASQPGGPNGDGTFSVDAKAGALDTLDYSSFARGSPVYVNLSSSAYSFDFDANGTIDTTAGEITIGNPYSATNINVGSPAAVGGAYGVNNFEVVISGAADDAIVGNDSANILVGNDGADRIAGLGGNDTLYGGKGDDYIIPGDGSDYVNGGEGINNILITSSDLDQDTFAVDPNGINIFKLNGDGSSSNASVINAPSGNWNPGAQGIDLLDGGDPVVSGGVTTTYDTIYGTINNDTYQFGGTALKNVSEINLKEGNDSVGTAPTSKGIKVSYDGGSGTNTVTLNLTFQQFAKLNQSGLFVADVQNYIDNPTGKTFSSGQADFTARNFQTGGVAVVTPAVYNALQGDPAALTFNSSVGLQGVNSSSGGDQSLSASANATSTATARSVEDLVSAFVQANTVKGADAVSISSGANLDGSATANQTANASAVTVNDRSEAVLSAYALGLDRSTLTAVADVGLALNGTVKADTLAEAVNSVVNANGTAEAAGSRDSSLAGGDAVTISISGSLNQSVSASTTDGLAIAGLASRAYGIDDANLTDSSADSIQAGSDLGLTVNASGISQVAAKGIDRQSLGPITLVDNGVASTDRFTLPSSLWGAAFPLINGDRLRFANTPSGGSLQVNRDYYVLNVIPVTGEFQLSSTPAGDPINVLVADNATSLDAFRPAVSTADAISTVTGVDLNRNAAGLVGLQAGNTLNLVAAASDAVTATASSVGGEASAGLNRLGSLDGLDTQLVSRVVALTDTTSVSGEDASLRLNARDSVLLQASSNAGDALSEGNAQVLASSLSPTTAGAELTLQATAALSQDARASSTAGAAEARSGAGAGAGTAALGNVVPRGDTYGLVTALADGDQTAGAALSLNANANLSLGANSTTVGSTNSLGSLWTNSSNVLSTFDPAASTPSLIGPQFLADGQRVQVDAINATALGLTANKDYVVRLIGSTAVDATLNRITVPADITYSNGNAIRFRLNSDVAVNSDPSRYGLELGTTYYVVGYTADPAGNSFQLSTAPGGAVIDLTADTTGAADQLVDADRFQLLVPPATPGAPYTVQPLTASVSGVNLLLPAESNAFAGSRQASITLADNSALNLAEVNGIDGSGLQAGAAAAINAAADGVLNAQARNTAGDATASAGLIATGLQDAAVTAGSDGNLSARATINAVADAASTGDNALVDNSLSTLNLSARGISADTANQDIRIGANGSITANAALDARSTASLVNGAADALGTFTATGLNAADPGINVSIGAVGDLSAIARVGSAANPALISALSSTVGDVRAQGAVLVEGIAGSTAMGSFASLQPGAAQGDILANASSDIKLQAVATDGAANARVADVSGLGPALVSGIRDMALTMGAGLSRIDTNALGNTQIEARSVSDDATSAAITGAQGILSTATALPVSFAQDGAIAALANNVTIAKALSVAGDASSGITSGTLGLSNAAVTVAGSADLSLQALSRTTSQAQSVAGNVYA